MDPLLTRQKAGRRAHAPGLSAPRDPRSLEGGGGGEGDLPPDMAPAPFAGGEEGGARGAVLDPLDEFFWREDEIAPGLPDLFGGTDARAAFDPPEAKREWLAFFLAGEEYAVAIEQVREILKAPAITEVPRAPDHVLGVIMVRGEVIAILDLRRRLRLPAAALGRQARVIVCDAGGGPRGFVVDAVSNVVRLPPSSVEARPAGIGGPAAEYISGIGREADRLVILLDAPALLGDAAAASPAEAP